MTDLLDSKELSADSPMPQVPRYLHRLAVLLDSEMPDAWKWASSAQLTEEEIETIRLDLLRNTIRLDRSAHPDVYDSTDEIAEKLNLKIPVTVYQEQNPQGWNAAAMPLPDEAHLMIAGPILEKLSRDELRVVLAHELGHVHLWRIEDRRFHTTIRLLDALSNDAHATAVHFNSARLARLHSEVYCDRIALHVVNDPMVVISALLKTGTESTNVDCKSFLKQAAEVVQTGKGVSSGVTHPELYLRARAIEWTANPECDVADIETSITNLLRGQPKLSNMDLLIQSRLAHSTRQLLDLIFAHRWMRTEAALSHAKLFFDDYTPSNVSKADAKELREELSGMHSSLQEYIAYILLDFATTDRELEDLPLALALDLAEQFSIDEPFSKFARKELRLRAKQVRDLNNKKNEMLHEASSK